ncbi:MAG: PTS glucose transporter subunit IIA [Cellulomonas sp.]|nr:PTS glucose transporter subunit IIA [Cellulomonas sp.]
MLVASPLGGTVRAVTEVPDPVFAELMVGPGVAIVPRPAARATAWAPCSGVVAAVHPHAFVVETADRRAVLVHVGIDTVRLQGQGFTLHVRAGDRVMTGDRIITWSPVDVAAAGLSTMCPVIALQAEQTAVRVLLEPGTAVVPGEPLLDWA